MAMNKEDMQREIDNLRAENDGLRATLDGWARTARHSNGMVRIETVSELLREAMRGNYGQPARP